MMDPGMLPQVQGIGSVYDGPRDVATSTRHRVDMMDPGMLPQVQGIGSVCCHKYDGPRDVATSTRHRVSI